MTTWALNPIKFISKNKLTNCVVTGCYSLLIFMGEICTSNAKATTMLNNSNNRRLSAATHTPRQSLCFKMGKMGSKREGTHLRSRRELMAILTYSGLGAKVTKGRVRLFLSPGSLNARNVSAICASQGMSQEWQSRRVPLQLAPKLTTGFKHRQESSFCLR